VLLWLYMLFLFSFCYFSSWFILPIPVDFLTARPNVFLFISPYQLTPHNPVGNGQKADRVSRSRRGMAVMMLRRLKTTKKSKGNSMQHYQMGCEELLRTDKESNRQRSISSDTIEALSSTASATVVWHQKENDDRDISIDCIPTIRKIPRRSYRESGTSFD